MCQKEKVPEKILVIDDEETMRDSCRQVLERQGLSIETAVDGKTGLEMADSVKPDLVILDLKMPGVQGIDVLKEMQKISPATVIIVITGYPTLESAIEAMKCGAYDFLPKPFTPHELRVVVKRALEHSFLKKRTAELEQEKEKIQNNFAAMLSHQLKTPLAAVGEYAAVLEKGVAGELKENQKELVARIHLRVKTMLNLVEDFLKLSRFEASGKLETMGKVDLYRVAVGAWTTVVEQCSKKKLEFEIKTPEGECALPNVKGDELLIREVFTNLFSNSLNYTPDGGVVTLEFLPPEGNCIVVKVSDTGVGIPPEEQPFVFDEFFRGSSEKNVGNVPGTGLGLSIVKRVMDAHNGKVSLQSRKGAGTTFILKFPISGVKESK
jgi:two-component system sensor histidine kinase/response regulator